MEQTKLIPIGYIYKTTNLVNNKIYVGKRQKSYFDKNYIGSGKKLKSAITHYGTNVFVCEVLQWCYTVAELNTAEQIWIKNLKATNTDIGYNISDGGNGGDIFNTLSEEQQQAIRQKLKQSDTGKGTRGKYRIYKGNVTKYILPEELNEYLAKGWIHALNPELAKKQGDARRGKKQSKDWIKKRCNAIWNKSEKEIQELKDKHSKAAKAQMANTSKEQRQLNAKKARQASLAKLNGCKAIWIHKNNMRKLVAENSIDEWVSLGWKRGFKLDE